MQHENDHIYDDKGQDEVLKRIRGHETINTGLNRIFWHLKALYRLLNTASILEVYPQFLLRRELTYPGDLVLDELVFINDDVVEDVEDEKCSHDDEEDEKHGPEAIVFAF